MRYIIITLCIFALLLIPRPGITSGEEHGPFISLFYAPVGLVSSTLPYASGNTSSSKKTYSVPGTPVYDYYSGYQVTGGYYYDFLQCEISYSAGSIKNREVAISSQRTEPVTVAYRYIDLKLGLRFSTHGDTSYSFLYAGAKKTYIDSDFSETKAETLGYMIGFSCFKSFGISTSVEFVLSFGLFAGSASFDYSKISYDSDFTAEEKTSYDFGLSLGIGLQYEPYNIAIQFKIKPVVHINEQKSGDERAGASLYGGYAGFEIAYALPGVKYNKVD